MKHGLVLRVDAKVCHVEVEGTTHALPLRGRLFEQPSQQARPIAVGDRVEIMLDDSGDGAIEAVLPRTSKLSRRTAGEGTKEQVLAANISLVMVTGALVEPPFQPDLIDRILAGVEREGLDAIVVLTKRDRDKKRIVDHWVPFYESLGYPTFATSVADGKRTEPELEELRKRIHANITVLSGLSGVGKSSLINALIPGFDLRVGNLSRIRQGRHTTTHTQLLALPGGGHVLDTPGIRNFGLYGLRRSEVAGLFREFRPHLDQCAYRDCSHLVEPDCAIQQAVEAGTIHRSRFDSYAALLDTADDSQ